MNRLSVSITAVVATICLAALNVFAQDPLQVAPQAYKLVFENEWVKVVRVRYEAREKIPAHDHTETAAAYVYLTDSGPVIFKHIGLAYGAITRQPVQAGSFRLYQAVKEVHEVENPNDTASEFLRVEFKTEPVNVKTLRGKFHRETYAAGEHFRKLQFENEQVRVTRFACAPRLKCEVAASATEPALLVGLTTARLKKTALASGWTKWLAAGKRESLEQLDAQHAEMLLFEFKTKPAKSAPPPAHPHD